MSKIRSKVVKQTINNKDVIDMFQGIIGTDGGSVNIPIAWTKYKNIKHHVDLFIRLIHSFPKLRCMVNFVNEQHHIYKYVESLQEQFNKSFTAPNLDAYNDFSKIEHKEIKQFVDVFTTVKNCNLVNCIIKTCGYLISKKHYIGDKLNLNGRFLCKAGLTYCPLPDLPAANFKAFYARGNLEDQRYILLFLHELYKISYDLYEALSSPDIDIDEFVNAIMSSLKEVRKHIPRCNEAFDKIAESVHLLKGNFNGYYRDYVASSNPTVIMENFVTDVAKNTKSSAKVTSQFRRIIVHYKKLASQQTNNPKMAAIFNQVDANFKELDRQTKLDHLDESDSDENETVPEIVIDPNAGLPMIDLESIVIDESKTKM
jgi:hypothetical protein